MEKVYFGCIHLLHSNKIGKVGYLMWIRWLTVRFELSTNTTKFDRCPNLLIFSIVVVIFFRFIDKNKCAGGISRGGRRDRLVHLGKQVHV
jgi:hypothetical protein